MGALQVASQSPRAWMLEQRAASQVGSAYPGRINKFYIVRMSKFLTPLVSVGEPSMQGPVVALSNTVCTHKLLHLSPTFKRTGQESRVDSGCRTCCCTC
eukprot:6490180-Amphidinium_carterae.1